MISLDICYIWASSMCGSVFCFYRKFFLHRWLCIPAGQSPLPWDPALTPCSLPASYSFSSTSSDFLFLNTQPLGFLYSLLPGFYLLPGSWWLPKQYLQLQPLPQFDSDSNPSAAYYANSVCIVPGVPSISDSKFELLTFLPLPCTSALPNLLTLGQAMAQCHEDE